MSKHKADMLAAVIDEFQLSTVAYIGNDETFGDSLRERTERELDGPGDNTADVTYLDDYGEAPRAAIQVAFEKSHGFVMGSQYDHQHIDVMRAVAEAFNLACVQVGPCGVWCVRR